MSFVKVDPDAWKAPRTHGRVRQQQKRRPWSACPRCSTDLRTKPFRSPTWHQSCPVCGTQCLPIWWQRYLMVAIAYALAVMVPALNGARDFGLLFEACLLANSVPATCWRFSVQDYFAEICGKKRCSNYFVPSVRGLILLQHDFDSARGQAEEETENQIRDGAGGEQKRRVAHHERLAVHHFYCAQNRR